jgi:hypothetical protein
LKDGYKAFKQYQKTSDGPFAERIAAAEEKVKAEGKASYRYGEQRKVLEMIARQAAIPVSEPQSQAVVIIPVNDEIPV